MGMFDWVDFTTKCPKCSKLVEGFQSKEGPCELYTIKPWQLSNFYAGCDGCGAWIEYSHNGGPESELDYAPFHPDPKWLDNYTLEVRGPYKGANQ